MGFAYTYLCVHHLCLALEESRRRYKMPWKWSYRRVWTALYMLETKLRSSTRVTRAFNYWAISRPYIGIFPVCLWWSNLCLQAINPISNFWSRDPRPLIWNIWITFISDSPFSLFILMLKRLTYPDTYKVFNEYVLRVSNLIEFAS